VIRGYEHNKFMVDIAKSTELQNRPKEGDKVEESCKSGTRMIASKSTKIKA
jgi:hypothetical protein